MEEEPCVRLPLFDATDIINYMLKIGTQSTATTEPITLNNAANLSDTSGTPHRIGYLPEKEPIKRLVDLKKKVYNRKRNKAAKKARRINR